MGNKEIDIQELEKRAHERYRECPKHTTVVRHADLEDDSVFHCVPVAIVGPHQSGKQGNRVFIVPGQEVVMVEDPVYGLFSIIRVFEQINGPEYALVISVRSRMGFSVEIEKFPPDLLQTEVQTDS